MTKEEILQAVTACTACLGPSCETCPLLEDPDCVQDMLLAMKGQLESEGVKTWQG